MQHKTDICLVTAALVSLLVGCSVPYEVRCEASESGSACAEVLVDGAKLTVTRNEGDVDYMRVEIPVDVNEVVFATSVKTSMIEFVGEAKNIQVSDSSGSDTIIYAQTLKSLEEIAFEGQGLYLKVGSTKLSRINVDAAMDFRFTMNVVGTFDAPLVANLTTQPSSCDVIYQIGENWPPTIETKEAIGVCLDVAAGSASTLVAHDTGTLTESDIRGEFPLATKVSVLE